jgi:hypothetical protein
MITGGSFVWVITLGVLVWAYVARRRRSRRTLDMWAREEAASDEADRVAALEAIEAARIIAQPADESGLHAAASNASIKPPMVEHDGHWHVLH